MYLKSYGGRVCPYIRPRKYAPEGGSLGKCFKPTNHDTGGGGRGIDYNNSSSVNYFSTLNISLYITFFVSAFHYNVYNICQTPSNRIPKCYSL